VTSFAVRGGGTGDAYMHAVAVDGVGGVVAVGYFIGPSATFGGVALTNARTATYRDAVVWKMNAAGTTRWAVRGGGMGGDTLAGVVVDGAGGVVAAGYFYSSSTGAPFGGVALTDAGERDAIVWKLNAEGTTLWAVRGGGNDDDRLYAVAVDGAGSVVGAGWFASYSATFGDVALTNAGSTSSYSRSDVVVWKLNAEGTTLWAVRGGGTGSDNLQAVAVDGAGAVVAAGYFYNSIATFGDTALTSAGGWDTVVWKLNARGTTLWAVRGGGTGNEYLHAVAVDGAGSVVAAGKVYSSSATFGGVALTSASKGLVWKTSAEGTTLWAVRGGGTNTNDKLVGVAVAGAGAVVAAGYFYGSLATFGGEVLTNAGSYDAVLWKVSAEGTTLWAMRGGGTGDDQLQAVAADGAGSVVAAGYFASSLATFGDTALTNAGSSDAVVLWKVSNVAGMLD